MLCLNIKAPFAAFRTFTAGSYRPTAPFITPSAAYGLLLNIVGIEMRNNEPEDAMTHIASGLPKLSLAIGVRQPPYQHTVYQQLHNYPVGSSGKGYKEGAKGSKYNIAPVRRAFLSGFDACIAVRAEDAFLDAIRAGVEGQGPARYGLPFLGDNSFLIDRIDVLSGPDRARWYVQLGEEEADAEEQRKDVARLTITINRADSSRTCSALFAPEKAPSKSIPGKAWVEVGY